MASVFGIAGKLADVLPSKVMASLGLGFISSASFVVVMNSLVTLVVDRFGSMVGAGFQLASLAGIPSAMGIILGAFVTRAAFQGASKIGRVS